MNWLDDLYDRQEPYKADTPHIFWDGEFHHWGGMSVEGIENERTSKTTVQISWEVRDFWKKEIVSRGLVYAEVGEIIGVPGTSVSHFLNEDRATSEQRYNQFVKFLGLPD